MALWKKKKFMSHIHEFSLLLNLLPPSFCYISVSLAETLLPRSPGFKKNTQKFLFLNAWMVNLKSESVAPAVLILNSLSYVIFL